jgi:hypothetical protein
MKARKLIIPKARNFARILRLILEANANVGKKIKKSICDMTGASIIGGIAKLKK